MITRRAISSTRLNSYFSPSPRCSPNSIIRTMSSSTSTSTSTSKAPNTTRPIVLCGPSGVGKSTLLKRLLDEFPGQYGFSVSHTTRAPRPGEEAGKHYHFVTKPEFLQLVSEGAFLEHAQFGENMYGTTARAVQDVSAGSSSSNASHASQATHASHAPQRAILDIDAQGVKLLKANHAYLDPLYLFISPPNLRALYDRLKGRGTETPKSVLARLKMARGEMDYAREHDGGNFDVVVVNDDVDRAYEKVFKRAIREGVQDGWKGDQIPPDEHGEEQAVLQAAQKDLDSSASTTS